MIEIKKIAQNNYLKLIPALIILSIFTFIAFNQSFDNTISISAVGDMVFPYNFENSTDYFLALLQYFNSDLNLGNLEGPITYYNKPSKNTSSGNMFVFRFSPDIIPNLLKYLNFNGVLVSNNHSNDYGQIGFNDTLKYLKQVDIQPIGLKLNINQFQVKNKKIGIIGFYYSSQFNDLRDLSFSKNIIKKAKENNDMVIVFFHGGTEGANAKYVYNKTEFFGNENRGNIFTFCHLAIDSGADLVLGSGPHILRGLEIYKGKLIVYSLGNFIALGGLSVKGELSISCILTVTYDFSSYNFLSGKIIPIDLSTKIPKYDNDKKAITFIKNLTNQIYKDNFSIQPDLLIDEDGLIKPKN